MRSLILLIDSFGVGSLPDADQYGDVGANTMQHICQSVKGHKWPNMRRMGLGNLGGILRYETPGLEPYTPAEAHYGVMAESSPGKDTTTGHWELMGIELKEPFHHFDMDYPSFPDDFIRDFVKKSGIKGILGNKAASGTEIIEELGPEHEKSGMPICYTSADSVFQIAAHVDVIPLEKLYELCEIARELCDPLNIGRVIARPFKGKSGDYERTADRKDYSLPLPGPSLFDHMMKNGVETIAIGKTGSIFNEQGFSRSFHDKGNDACLERCMSIMKEGKDNQLIFANLVDTDMIYGHRRDPEGYFQAVDNIDSALHELLPMLKPEDNLIITADHGCDPCFQGTDHTREYVPLLFHRSGMGYGKNLGIRNSFADLAATLADLHGIPSNLSGLSFADQLV